jgi:hypothetical protein
MMSAGGEQGAKPASGGRGRSPKEMSERSGDPDLSAPERLKLEVGRSTFNPPLMTVLSQPDQNQPPAAAPPANFFAVLRSSLTRAARMEIRSDEMEGDIGFPSGNQQTHTAARSDQNAEYNRVLRCRWHGRGHIAADERPHIGVLVNLPDLPRE